MSQRKKHELKKLHTFTISEPRFIRPRETATLTRFNIFAPIVEDAYLDEQLSHAVYDIEIANSRGMKGKK